MGSKCVRAAAEEPVLLSELDQARLDLISAARTSVEDVREWQHNHDGISDYSVNMAVDSSTEWRALHVLCSQRDAVSVRVDTVPPRVGELQLPSLALRSGVWHGAPAAGVPLQWSGFADDGTGVVEHVACGCEHVA